MAALIAEAPEPRPTLVKTLNAMMARESRVLRRNAVGTFTRATGSVNFATILVPGLMASMLLMPGIMAVTFPLVMEFSWQRTIEDRALAPVPIQVLAIQKIVAGAVQSFIGAVIVFRSCCSCTRRVRHLTCA